ncbi:MAG TPA: DUF2637 domain-containing protein [Arthrobacter sp.]
MSPTTKAARISPESRPIAYTAVGLAASIYLGAFATSFFGQAALAAYMAIPYALQFVVPAVIDLALILFTLATLLRKTRGESTAWTNLATAFWTAVSIAANIFHVLVPAGPMEGWSFGTYTGAALSALMPLGALGASLVLENLLIEPPLTGVADESATTPRGAQAVQVTKAAPKAALVDTAAVAAALPTPLMRPAPQAARRKIPADAKSPEMPGELAARVLAYKAEGLTIPAIAVRVKMSESTVKRILKVAKEAGVVADLPGIQTQAA